jgi:hypothetical protein
MSNRFSAGLSAGLILAVVAISLHTPKPKHLNVPNEANTAPPTFAAVVGQTTVAGTKSGSAVFSEPMSGASYKRVSIYLSNLVGTASFAYPVAFTHVPGCIATTLACSLITNGPSTTTLTVAGTGNTGFLLLEGY